MFTMNSENFYSSVLEDDQLKIEFKLKKQEILGFELLLQNNFDYIENKLVPDLLVWLTTKEFSCGNKYKIFSADISYINYNFINGKLELYFNNINYEKICENKNERKYKFKYSNEDFSPRTKVIYNTQTGNLTKKLEITDNIMFEIIGLNITAKDLYSASKFINNISGLNIKIPIFNEWENEVIIKLNEYRIKKRTRKIDMIYSNFCQIINLNELSKLYSVQEHYTCSNKSAIVDFVLNFSKFEETIKHKYLMNFYSSSKPYNELYRKYIDELNQNADNLLKKEQINVVTLKKILKDCDIIENQNLFNFLNSAQKKIFKDGYIKKENKLNNLPDIINNFEYKEQILSICSNLWKVEENKGIEDITTFKKIRNYKNQRLWLIYNLFTSPKILTDFRNKYYHSLEVQHDVIKVRVYSEILNLILMITTYIELGITEKIIEEIVKNFQHNWTEKIIAERLE